LSGHCRFVSNLECGGLTPLYYLSVRLSFDDKAPSSRRTPKTMALSMQLKIVSSLIIGVALVAAVSAQTRRRPRTTQPQTQTQAPRGSAAKYSAFLHLSEKHKSLECNACHKIPTAWTARRDFPDVADFPDHDACVRCHRQQFFTRQAMIGTGPAICAVCHVRAAPREDTRFAFGKPSGAGQTMKPKDERQFTIEFPHDKHQNVIARLEFPPREWGRVWGAVATRTNLSPNPSPLAKRGAIQRRFMASSRDGVSELRLNHRLLISATLDEKKPDYNNCSICHQTNMNLAMVALPPANTDPAMLHPFKSMPRAHDACFNCHWKNLKPASDDCAGCHKPATTFVAVLAPKRISAKFAHEGGKGEHLAECTTCHINITRASTLRGLTPDVPIAACTTCHKDNKKTTYPKIVTIEEEFEQNKKTGECTYCHTSDVGKKKPPPSHDAAAQ
jgi:hypothetical protein